MSEKLFTYDHLLNFIFLANKVIHTWPLFKNMPAYLFWNLSLTFILGKLYEKSIFSILASDSSSSEDLLNFWSFQYLVNPLKGVIIS